MNNVYLRSNHNIKNISLKLFISLLPLIIAGFYKNGIKLYQHNLVGIFGLLKPLLFSLLGFIIGVLVNIIYHYILRKDKDKFLNIVFNSFHPIYGIIIASVISINTNILLFSFITFIMFLISKFFKNTKFNVMAATALIIILIFYLTGNFSFSNVYEISTVLNLNTLDYLIGMGSGGINTSFVLFILISFLFLASQDYYKKSIALSSSIVFSSIMIIYSIINNQVGLVLENIFANGILFCFVFIATETLSSSYTKSGQIVFGTLVGGLTFLLFLIEPTLAALGAILIVSLLHLFIDYICLKKS
ncbi:MAG: RnfABCDGE type electron transport complex subunit D [Bacilli bacterium]|nr:RnfABCDGE type electron transport complex subunit D [Bacilli bacterium]